jgi:hypothetical protein
MVSALLIGLIVAFLMIVPFVYRGDLRRFSVDHRVLVAAGARLQARLP